MRDCTWPIAVIPAEPIRCSKPTIQAQPAAAARPPESCCKSYRPRSVLGARKNALCPPVFTTIPWPMESHGGRLRWPRPSRVSPSAWLNAAPALCKGGSPQACDDLLGRQTGRLLLHRNPRRLVCLEGAANIHGRQTELHRLQRQRRTRWTERPGAAARENAKYLGECQG